MDTIIAWWDPIHMWLDLVLITPYRWFGNPVAGFFFGTLVLSVWCVLLGELTFRVAARVNREHIRKLRGGMTRMHNLSVKALMLRDKENYRACNTEANEAFGRYFFSLLTLGAAVLWPIPFALAWMNNRFGHIEFDILFTLPLLGSSAGFSAVMIPMYILCRILWAALKRRFPVISHGAGAPGSGQAEEMISMKEVDRYGGVPKRFWNNGES